MPSFPCIFSGLTVEDLGYCSFIIPSKGIFSSELWRDKSIISLNNIKIFSLNLPFTYPAWKINGEMISGLITPQLSAKMCFPHNLIDTIKKDWIIDGKNINEIFKAFDLKKEYFYNKLKNDFDLLIYIIRIPDCITHHPKIRLKATMNAIKKGYVEIDKYLGFILKDIDFDNIFIISDHGLKLYQHEFNIKRFLEKKKLIFQNDDIISKFLSLLIKVLGYFNLKLFNSTYFHNKFKKFIRNLKKYNVPDDNLLDSTKFVHFYSNYGGIFLSREDKKKKDRIKKILLASKYVKHVKVYNTETLPDLIIILEEKYLFSVKSSFFVENRFNSFNHSDKGIFISYGKNIKKIKNGVINYIDFAPTLLKLYNFNKLDHMKGSVLKILKNIEQNTEKIN